MLPTLILSLTLLAAPAPSATAQGHFERGVEALRAKDAAGAVSALAACVAAAPERADCRWELGWAHWLAGDWAQVVAQWEQVERLDPKRPELAEKLAEARAQQALQRKLAEARDAPPAPPPPVPPGTALRVRAVGDVMLGSDFPAGYLAPEDGATLLADVAGLLADADLTFVNLEGPLCDGGATKKCRKGAKPGSCYAFRSPTRYGAYLVKAGVDLASTANNHSGDFGEECRRQTESALDKLGIGWSGPPGSIATVERAGTKIALVAFHTSASCNHLNDVAGARALVRAAAADHHLVFVSFHGGAEGAKALHIPEGGETFYGEDRGDLRVFARAVVDAGADLVLGHGPHVVRAMEVYKDRLVAYSLGNFATYGRFNLSGPLGIGVILEANLDGEGRFVGGRLLPTRQLGKGVPVRDPEANAVSLVRKLSDEDFPESGVIVEADGTLRSRKPPAIAAPSSKGPPREVVPTGGRTKKGE